ncbi:MbtH family protein [Streptomyces mirabilis]|uniref:MbtH family protein n=1 Tax=Streptomyces mirabilis TaxID=68239 RepID=UPI0033A15789
MTDALHDNQTYQVVVNHEEQYSIWPAQREVPEGWRPVGATGPKDDCLAYVNEVWTDMRPLSLRRQMDDPQLERTDR